MYKPNIIIVFTDQQRWDSTGVNGNPLGLTPNFDYMAKTGTHFNNSFTCQPVCGPARSSLQTGLYPTNTGIWRNGLALKEDAVTLAHLFNTAGYKTGYIGKWHLSGGYPGITDWKQEPVSEEKRGGYKYWLGAELPEFVSDASHPILFNGKNETVRLPGYRVDAYTDAAINFVNRNKNNPFLLFLSIFEPHHQNNTDSFVSPRGYDKMYEGRWIPPDLQGKGSTAYYQLGGYWGTIKRIDEALGRLLDTLTSLDIMENTIVFFTSDHGNHFKTRNSEYKRSCHESSTHIPFAAIGPGFNGGGLVDNLVSLIDIPPTVLDSAGIKIPDYMEGHSVLPLVKNEKVEWQDDVYIQISEDKVSRAVRTRRWKYAVTAFGIDGNSQPDAEEYTEEFLYDLKVDPYEQDNIITHPAYSEVRKIMRKRLLKRMETIEGKRVKILSAQGKKTTDQRVVFENELYE